MDGFVSRTIIDRFASSAHQHSHTHTYAFGEGSDGDDEYSTRAANGCCPIDVLSPSLSRWTQTELWNLFAVIWIRYASMTKSQHTFIIIQLLCVRERFIHDSIVALTDQLLYMTRWKLITCSDIELWVGFWSNFLSVTSTDMCRHITHFSKQLRGLNVLFSEKERRNKRKSSFPLFVRRNSANTCQWHNVRQFNGNGSVLHTNNTNKSTERKITWQIYLHLPF